MPSNMKLSELVKLKEELQKHVDISKLSTDINHYRGVFARLNSENIDFDLRVFIEQAMHKCEDALKHIQETLTDVASEYQLIDSKISEMSAKYFAANYQMALTLTEEGERQCRNKVFTEKSRDILAKRLRTYSDWHYPALEIGPGSGVWTHELVGNDPLYLLDIRQSYLNETLESFTPEYQRRLRTYLIPEDKPEDLSFLPQEQFGFVVSINVFEYFAFDKIRHYLEEVWKLLKPGGVFLFSYNNGERPASAQLAEHGVVSYIPKTMLVTFCETHGYELLATYDLDATVSWIEIRKPGQLKTVKAHQAMGEIIHRPS